MNEEKKSTDFDKYTRRLGCFFLFLFLFWILSNIFKWKWQLGLSEYSIVILILLSTALFLAPFIKYFKLPGGFVLEFRNLSTIVKRIQSVQLISEVVFNEKNESELYWYDKNKKLHLLPDEDVASLFVSPKGSISVDSSVFDKLYKDKPIPKINQDSFRYVPPHLYIVLDDMIFYQSSWSLASKYGLTSVKMKEIKSEDIEKEFKGKTIIK